MFCLLPEYWLPTATPSCLLLSWCLSSPILVGVPFTLLGLWLRGTTPANNRLWPKSIAHELKNKINKKRKLPFTLKDQFLSFCSWCISLTCTQVISIMVTHTQKNFFFFFPSWKCSWAVCQTTWPGKTFKEAVAASSCGSCTAWANSVLSPGYCLSFVVLLLPV